MTSTPKERAIEAADQLIEALLLHPSQRLSGGPLFAQALLRFAAADWRDGAEAVEVGEAGVGIPELDAADDLYVSMWMEDRAAAREQAAEELSNG